MYFLVEEALMMLTRASGSSAQSSISHTVASGLNGRLTSDGGSSVGFAFEIHACSHCAQACPPVGVPPSRKLKQVSTSQCN